MTREKRVTLGSGQHDPRPTLPASCFLLTRGSDPRIRPADRGFYTYLKKAYSVPKLNSTPFWYHNKKLKHRQNTSIRMSASIHTRYSYV